MKRFVIGLTGGIAAGKSLALREFARLGARTVSLDDIAHAQARQGGPAYRPIMRAFGASVADEKGRIDRRKLGQQVFASAAARRRLEKITHPLILREMRRRIGKMSESRRFCVVDAPLLFEAGLEKQFDLTLLVSAAEPARMSRIRKRDGLSARQARRRISAQMPEAEKERRADVVLRNTGSKNEFIRSIRQYYGAFQLIGA